MLKPWLVCAVAVLCVAAAQGSRAAGDEHPFGEVDQLFGAVRAGIGSAKLVEVLEIDHARLAMEADVVMPAARVVLFSDPRVTAHLLHESVRSGLDLPFRALAYSGGSGARVIYADSSFLKLRHGFGDSPWLGAMDEALAAAMSSVEGSRLSAVPVDRLTRDYGIRLLTSDHSFEETVGRLTRVIRAQGDTVWFGEIDYTADAKSQGVEIPPARLLLFGGPAPGGVAMAEFPSLGLDAFCQKLLVYEDEAGQVQVIFNEIAALAELHYGRSAPPNHMLDQRLTSTFAQALR